MIAPLEFSRNAKMVSGQNAAAITHRKPTIDDVRIAVAGTPRRVTRTNCAGASRRAAKTNSMREAVYIPELRQLEHRGRRRGVHHVVGVGACPCLVNAATNGEAGEALVVPGQDRHE